jgi:hypothetical protein
VCDGEWVGTGIRDMTVVSVLHTSSVLPKSGPVHVLALNIIIVVVATLHYYSNKVL